MSKTIEIEKHERVIAVVPEFAAGPGWTNTPIWVYILDGFSNKVRTECIQPNEQSEALRVLFHPGATMCRALICAVPIREKPNAPITG